MVVVEGSVISASGTPPCYVFGRFDGISDYLYWNVSAEAGAWPTACTYLRYRMESVVEGTMSVQHCDGELLHAYKIAE